MKAIAALAASITLAAGAAQAAALHFHQAPLGFVFTDEVIEARASYVDGSDLIVTLKPGPGPARLVKGGLEARLFPLGAYDRQKPGGWAHTDPWCAVYLTVLAPVPKPGRDGQIVLWRLKELLYVTPNIDGTVSPGRYLLVLQQAGADPDPLIRLDDRGPAIENYFRHAIYFEVTPRPPYDARQVRDAALAEAGAAGAVRARAEAVDPQVACYNLRRLAEHQPGALVAQLDRCAPPAERAEPLEAEPAP